MDNVSPRPRNARWRQRAARSDNRVHVSRIVELRSYNLKPDTGAEFHRLVTELSVPMLRLWQIDLVAYGPSRHDTDSYFLIRAFDSLEDRERSEEAYYGSEEWRLGPRDAIVACIESYTSVVLELDDDGIDALRRA